MADIRCPMCGKPNPQELDECQYCGARIKPVVPSHPVDSQALKPGEEPIKRKTSEFEKAKPTGEVPIHLGEAPTRENTGEPEGELPSWLRSLREGERLAAGESLAESSSDEGLPAASQAIPGPDSSGGLPDYLTGLGKVASDDEEVPEWLAGLRSGESSETTPAQAVEAEPAPELGNEDWMKRLGSEPSEATPEPNETAKLPGLGIPAFEPLPEPAPEGNLPDWLQNLQSPGPGVQEPAASSQDGEKLPDWLSGLPGISSENAPAFRGTEEPAATESMPDSSDQQDQKSIATETGTPAEAGESVPDWLSSFRSVPSIPGSTPGENVPDWLSNLEAKSGPESGIPAALSGGEPSAAMDMPAGTPDQTTPSSGAPQALVEDNQDIPPGGEGEPAFSMQAPKWLSELNPDQDSEKAAEGKDGQADSGNIEAADLPSWVKAMRPVEAVVESKTTPLNENQITELSGPLAGLRGVLPAGPGLGQLRRPPTYSTKIQVSDGQHRYATSLEQLVAGETQPRAVETTRLPSNRLWRWWIAVLLILAAGLPFASGVRIAPATLLLSSDKGASSKIIEGLPGNAPVLVAFDFDPALFGELEAVAAPIMDQLLSKGTPLALLSTSPTGPALAEQFLKTTSLVNVHQYQSGEQYVNLGYLAGGPAGMLYLADSLTNAMPVSVDGKSAWDSGPLQGIRSLSNFAAVIILTDNADTGRNWIEQAGPSLGNTPMLMIISAQAEPIIRPYFDSGQLKGLVSGLSDAKIYEQTYNRPGLADHYWNSFSVGMLVAELLIVAGAILGVMADRRRIRKNSRGEA